MNFARAILPAVLLAAVVVSQTQAGVLMVNVTKSSDQPDQARTDKIYLDKDRVRVEESTGQIAVFRQDKEVFWTIDPQTKTYTEMTRQDLEKMKSRMDEASRQMDEQMKNLPPEQRKMMESMMAGKMPPRASQIVYAKVASGETVNQWVCDQYVGSLNGQKQSDVWTTDWKNLGLQAEDFNALKEMGEFFSAFARGAESFFKVGAAADEHHYAGVPIRTIRYSGDKMTHTNELKEVSRQDFDASLFELPAGFTKKDVGWGPKEK